MYRQTKRRIARKWKKIRCFTICTDKITLAEMPYTALECSIKLSDEMLVRFCLSIFKQWRMYPLVVVDGFFFQGLCYNVGAVSDEWLDMVFGDNYLEGS